MYGRGASQCCPAALPVASAAPTLTTAPEGLIRRCCSCGSYGGAGAEDDTLTSTPSGPCSLWWRPMMDSGAAGRGEEGRGEEGRGEEGRGMGELGPWHA